ncbi:MAG: protein-L-isoaspartate(D-aspartate) O-methyltransferase [Candidatus Nanohaloarchaeota archaeon QJJ-9]|nr:protein-L-isoaspartate(D-aspartate) O-methyltransferase [Candidatus Nanohaloarchaeota archaeon QJJ-9]
MAEEDWSRLVETLKQKGYLETERIERSILSVDRAKFVDQAREEAYQDVPLPIGEGQTVSAPHMVAMMTEAIRPEPGDNVLEIGAGSGFQAAVVSEVVKEVHTVEIKEELVEKAKDNLKDYGNVQVYHKDGSDGLPQQAPFDKILFTASTPKVPEKIVEQLKEGGRLVVPLEEGFRQDLKVYRKEKGGIVELENRGAVRFVPMKGGVRKDQK